MKPIKLILSSLLATAMFANGVGIANAAEKIRVADSQKGFWDTTFIQYAEESKGFFKEAGIDLDILWTDGGADTQQAIISGSLDIGLNTGTLGVIGPIAKGAPLTIISAAMTGSPDIYWYVTQNSAIKSFKDTDGKSVSFSRVGSSSHSLALDLGQAAGVKPNYVSTGGPAATLTQTLSGQIDVGWAAGLFGANELIEGKIRRIAVGNDVPGVADQTVRVNVVNSNFLKAHTALVKKFLDTYQKALDWAYTDPQAIELFAKMNNVSPALAKKVRDDNYPKKALALRPIGDFKSSMEQAVANKRLDKPLTPEQMKEMLRYVDELK
ncbi:MAG: ABC transporter substrate-binding protein [Variovorax sp.]